VHELSIAESILDGIRAELLRYPGARPVRVGVRIGELAAVDVDSLTFCFEAVVKVLSGIICGWMRAFAGSRGDAKTAAKSLRSRSTTQPAAMQRQRDALTSGDELDFDYLEVETMERLPLKSKVLNENQIIAERLRESYRAHGILCLNLISSPGSGKTALLERTLATCPGDARVRADRRYPDGQ